MAALPAGRADARCLGNTGESPRELWKNTHACSLPRFRLRKLLGAQGAYCIFHKFPKLAPR